MLCWNWLKKKEMVKPSTPGSSVESYNPMVNLFPLWLTSILEKSPTSDNLATLIILKRKISSRLNLIPLPFFYTNN